MIAKSSDNTAKNNDNNKGKVNSINVTFLVYIPFVVLQTWNTLSSDNQGQRWQSKLLRAPSSELRDGIAGFIVRMIISELK